MPPKFIRLAGCCVLSAAILALAATTFDHPILFYIFKPTATLFILSVPVWTWLNRRNSYAMYVSAGLLLSAIGDILLMLAADYFLYGLLAFLLAHVVYLLAFSERVPFPASPRIWRIYFATTIVFYLYLYRALPRGLGLAVAVYCIFLTSMAAQAMGRFFILPDRFSRAAAFGALLFLISDCILSIDRFRSAIPGVHLLVLTPYYLGQWLIAFSTAGPYGSHSDTSASM